MRRIIGESRKQFDEKNEMWNGLDERVRRHGTLIEMRESNSGLSIFEDGRLDREDKFAEYVRSEFFKG